jgi:hypothetical protein
MNYIHTIPVHLYDNPLTDDPNDLYARIETNKTLTIADICRSVVERTHAPVDLEMMEMCVRKFLEEMLYRACDGYGVNAEYFNMALHIKGAFEGTADHFDPARHKIVAEFHEGAHTRRYIDDNASIEIRGKAAGGARIEQVKDAASGQLNSGITAGNAITVSGSHIKLAGSNAAVGVYLMRQSDGASFQLAAAQMIENNPSKLIFLLPAGLTAGAQITLTIKTQYTGSAKLLNEPRSINFDKTLTII